MKNEINNSIYSILSETKRGSNSRGFKVENNNKLYFLKLMVDDFDLKYDNEYIPKLYFYGQLNFCNEKYYYRLYEYIEGKLFSEINFLSLKLFESIILLFISIHNDNMCIIDIHGENFILSHDERVYYIDSGGIGKTSEWYSKFRKAYYNTLKEPEEYSNQETLNYSEAIEIFYLGIFLAYTFKEIDKNVKKILKKMTAKELKNRFKNFLDILEFIKLNEY